MFVLGLELLLVWSILHNLVRGAQQRVMHQDSLDSAYAHLVSTALRQSKLLINQAGETLGNVPVSVCKAVPVAIDVTNLLKGVVFANLFDKFGTREDLAYSSELLQDHAFLIEVVSELPQEGNFVDYHFSAADEVKRLLLDLAVALTEPYKLRFPDPQSLPHPVLDLLFHQHLHRILRKVIFLPLFISE